MAHASACSGELQFAVGSVNAVSWSFAATARSQANKQAARWWIYAAAAAAVYLAFQVYAPALNGPYVFDDLDLPYHFPAVSSGLQFWISSVRPLLLLSYGVNYQFSAEPFGFHVEAETADACATRPEKRPAPPVPPVVS